MRSSQTEDPLVCNPSANTHHTLVGITYIIVHKRCALDENSSIVRESRLVDVGTVLSNVSTIVDQPPIVIDVVDVPEPLPRLVSVFSVGIVSGISRKTSADVKEASIGNSYTMSVKPPPIHTQCNPLFL